MIVETPAFYHSSVAYARHIARDSLSTAHRFLDAVYATLEVIHATLRIGRPWPHDLSLEVRVWRVSGFPNHLIFYRPIEKGIEAIDLIHGARDLDSLVEDF